MDLELYKRLFVHRTDVFAEQSSNGSYFPHKVPITDFDLEEHLGGVASYGTYVIRPSDQTVKYVVFDLDTYDQGQLETLTEAVAALLNTKEPHLPPDLLRSVLLEDSGGKGYHVWLFLDSPLTASVVRRWLERDFHFPHSLEVFPKQDSVEDGGYGNLVKLPLGKHGRTGRWSEFSAASPPGWATSIDEVVPLPVTLVPEVAPARSSSGSIRTAGPVETASPSTPFPCIDRVLEGDLEPGVRNNALFHLALYLHGHGIEEDLAYEQVNRANERSDRSLDSREIRTLVHSAYAGRRHGARCGTDWLRAFCPGPCKAGWKVGAIEGGALGRLREGDTVNVEVVSVDSGPNGRRITVSHPDASNRPTLRT